MRSAILVLVVSLIISVPVLADSHEGVAKEVIALAKAQWAAGIAKDTAKQISFLADDFIEVNPGDPTRIVRRGDHL